MIYTDKGIDNYVIKYQYHGALTCEYRKKGEEQMWGALVSYKTRLELNNYDSKAQETGAAIHLN